MIKFTKEHEWIKIEGNIGIVGITAHAKTQLGNLVYIELPKIGIEVKKGKEIAIVESVKAASEIYAPLSGEIIETNLKIVDNPSLIDESPQDQGWFFKLRIQNLDELTQLMSEESYKSYIKD
ncbi:MAG: glycine cleavage system protein GcvH [Alphaproteobacteria bacterium]|nr:glycine cleavage system protein GcvH [Alphaproteobacteria bacterium]